MSAENQNPEEDPMIGDILSSIKSIINEDEEDAPKAAEAAESDDLEDDLMAGLSFDEEIPAVEPEPVAEPVATPAVAPTPTPIMPAATMDDMEESIISSATADIGAQQFVKLNNMIRMGNSNVTLSDIVRSLLRPMLREWLDENLPAMVEQKVEYEIKRLVNRVED